MNDEQYAFFSVQCMYVSVSVYWPLSRLCRPFWRPLSGQKHEIVVYFATELCQSVISCSLAEVQNVIKEIKVVKEMVISHIHRKLKWERHKRHRRRNKGKLGKSSKPDAYSTSTQPKFKIISVGLHLHTPCPNSFENTQKFIAKLNFWYMQQLSWKQAGAEVGQAL